MVTEFDEQATSKQRALFHLAEMHKLFLKGDETMGVVQGYEDAARNIGVSEADINACYATNIAEKEARV